MIVVSLCLDLIEFTPGVAGKYKLMMTYGGEEIPGSPLVYTVQEDRTPTVFGKGLSLGQVLTPPSPVLDTRSMEATTIIPIQNK